MTAYGRPLSAAKGLSGGVFPASSLRRSQRVVALDMFAQPGVVRPALQDIHRATQAYGWMTRGDDQTQHDVASRSDSTY